MTNINKWPMENTGDKNDEFNLEERTARFGEAVLRFAKKIPKSSINNPLISQVVRAATSIGGELLRGG